ncbi:hypothetical protein WSK_0824 [Novosphingobium sp. Rr 2-17]|nr:hypothetical protein WSK_0824 [Novosphingobium sp. Rr 2-17]
MRAPISGLPVGDLHMDEADGMVRATIGLRW